MRLVRKGLAVALTVTAVFFTFALLLAMLWLFASGDRWQPLSRGLLYLTVAIGSGALAKALWPPRRSRSAGHQ
jgi:hypothetical protein